ncbi:hypothetical protein GCM10010358_03510 [Streptomyces minutiscleroticus]|uniref:DNA-directed RNA polymerase specialized sigma24 family protein n=1 Tax=Streptomyces minutiscleroticus TaxID=68238 RepID=A0A918K903_9ACTN|nr:hypothetical protein [Streptomyces minutiscleroticus]GGX52982.1 hypothetical protein GCM10010358_03510 [Streptomyces minutiscleroticus]
MQPQDVVTRPSADPVVDVERAEAALVEHYPRLVRLAYLVLPPRLGRKRRVLTAHALVQRALPRGRAGAQAPAAPVVPAQQAAGRHGDAGYAFVRLQVVRTALEAARPLLRGGLPRRAQLPPLLPQVWGLRLFPRSGGADELALDQRLAALSGPARAACALRALEQLPDAYVREVLAMAGVDDPDAALREAGDGGQEYALLDSPEFDPCSLQARPTDLVARRRRTRAALAAAVAAAVCGTLLALPGDGWGSDGPAAPPYARNAAAQAALEPDRLTRAAPAAWKTATRRGFAVWPARGGLTDDKALLRRALAVWARPGASVRVSATAGTPAGGPAGPPQLLYAGEVDRSRVVLLYDGLRVARYAEPRSGTSGAALDFARVDGADGAEAAAVVLDRTDGNVRYLTAPWVTGTAVRDLLKPGSGAARLGRSADGVTDPLAGPAERTGACRSWNVLELTDAGGTRMTSDLGELVPAHLTSGRPGAPQEADPAAWSPLACSLAAVRGQGVRSVNAWQFAAQPLPDGSGTAAWLCTRAETWRGTGAGVLAQFRTPGGPYAAVAARAADSAACGPRDPHVLAGVLWKSGTGEWHLLAAGDPDTASVATTGAVEARAAGNLLTAPAEKGAQATLKGRLTDGQEITGLR